MGKGNNSQGREKKKPKKGAKAAPVKADPRRPCATNPSEEKAHANRRGLTGAALGILIAGCASADPAAVGRTPPRQVLLIRHTEKPADDVVRHLSPAGEKPAAELLTYP